MRFSRRGEFWGRLRRSLDWVNWAPCMGDSGFAVLHVMLVRWGIFCGRAADNVDGVGRVSRTVMEFTGRFACLVAGNYRLTRRLGFAFRA